MGLTVVSRFGATLIALPQRLLDLATIISATINWTTIKGVAARVSRPTAYPSAHDTADEPGLSLSARFAFAASIVLCNGMVVLGGWVATEIEKGLLQAAATEQSAFVQRILEPAAVDLVSGGTRGQHQIALVDDRIARSAMLDKKRLPSVVVWRADGSVAYSLDKDLIGRSFPLTADIQSAFAGDLRTNLWEMRLLEIYRKRPDEIPARMIYAPLRDPGSGHVVAVAAFADTAAISKPQLDAIRNRTWYVVGTSTALMVLLLSGIVHKGSRTIDAQRQELEQRYKEQALLAQTNQRLCERLQASNQHGIELGEQLLRRIGMDLQNGPAQMLALALLRMDELKSLEERNGPRRTHPSSTASSAVELVERATADALKEIRAIEAGLIMPELRKLSPSQAVEKVIRAHEYVTRIPVERELSRLPAHLPLPVLICIFRFVQTALADAVSTETDAIQRVDGFGDGASVTITVHDEQPDLTAGEPLIRAQALRELRQRVESIGGTIEAAALNGRRTRTLVLPYSLVLQADAAPDDQRPPITAS